MDGDGDRDRLMLMLQVILPERSLVLSGHGLLLVEALLAAADARATLWGTGSGIPPSMGALSAHAAVRVGASAVAGAYVGAWETQGWG